MPSARSRASVRGRAGRVAREVQRAGELAFGDDDRAEGHVKFVGYLLGGERSSRPEQAIGASQGDDGAGGPRLRPAVAYDAEAGGVGDYLPGGLSVGPSEKARAPGRGQGGGALTGRSVVGQQRCGCALTGSNIGDGRKPLAHGFADQVSLTALENRLIAELFKTNGR